MLTGKNLTIRSLLSYLVAACAVPVWLTAALLVRHAYVAKIEQLNRDMLETARTMTMVVDRELANVQAALVALATSPSFAEADYGKIHRQCLEVLKAYPGADIIVADSGGQQLVNSYRPFGNTLPKRNNPDLVRRIFETGKPVVSNLFFGAVTKRPLIAIDVPVFVEGKIAYDLSMTFSSEKLSSVLQRQSLYQKGWYAVVLDRNGVIAARTLNQERYVGKPALSPLLDAMAAAREGFAEFKNRQGVPVLTAFSRSPISGWAVTFGVPKATVMAEIYKWMALAVGGATIISLFGILLAMRIAHAIASDLGSLVPPALLIGRGKPVGEVVIDSVKETADVAQALVQASELLQRRSKERDLAEEQLSRMIEDLRRETAERLRAMEELRTKEQMLIQQSRQAAMGEMIGNIAHQWRQPLNALGLLVQQPPLFARMGEVNQKFLEEHAGKSMKIIHHMSQTIDDFRNFFKPDKEKRLFKVRVEFEKTVSLIEGNFKVLEIALGVEVEGDPEIDGYPNEYSQVLLNILLNARDAIVERKVPDPRISVRIREESGATVVTIADNAGGIPDEIISKVFDPYFTTKGPQTGTGVGLFMSKNIIEKNMGGLISVRNFEGGAEFRIEV